MLGNHDYMGNVEAQLSPVLQRLDRRWNCKRNFIVGAGIYIYISLCFLSALILFLTSTSLFKTFAA